MRDQGIVGMTIPSSGSALPRAIVTRKRALVAVAMIATGVWAAEAGWMTPYLAGVGVAIAEQSIAWLVRKRR